MRKACEHLEGFGLEHGLDVTKEQQDSLARTLLARAPNSLADPPGVLKGKHQNDRSVSYLVHVHINHTVYFLRWDYDNKSQSGSTTTLMLIKKSVGEVKKRKKEDDSNGTTAAPQPEEDEAALKAHCLMIEKECKKKDGAKDYGKIFRLLTCTRDYRRKWMLGMSAPTRVITSLNAYPCLKKPLMVS